MTIQILPPQLANQIAAGEVVERPASIIKELIENSIDAGATRIDIDLEQGGCKLIRIRDNGSGIAKDELALALARHATSKISSLDDLEAIISLGFRGEALASISSVSRLTLTSKTQDQTEAWQVYAEGRDMSPIIKPASHPTGTTVEVLDLFYNTPARKRFLKTEKTEFAHIDEIVRRIALAYPCVAFNVQHNGKLVKQYRIAESDEQIEKRVGSICGISFMQKSIKLEWEHDDLSIRGWISPNNGQEAQYFYVNNRVVKDKLLNHALRQAFLESNQTNISSTDSMLGYVIYLTLDPHQVDVNVHPAKHEVRFHESRLVHDFVHQAVAMALNAHKKQSMGLLKQHDEQQPLNNRAAAGQSIFNTPSVPANSVSTKRVDNSAYSNSRKSSHINENKLYGRLVEPQQQSPSHVKEEYVSPEQKAVIESLFPVRNEPLTIEPKDIGLSSAVKLGKVLTVINNEYALLEKNENQKQVIRLLSLKKAQLALFKCNTLANRESNSMEKLLIPLSILLSKKEQDTINLAQATLETFHFEFYIEKSKLQLIGVPKLMRKANWQQLLPNLISSLSLRPSSTELEQLIYQWLSEQYLSVSPQETTWSVPKVIQFLMELEQLNECALNIDDMIKTIDLSSVISLFE